ncbi:APC family permease [Halorussus gelatinilyticus]|uniref:APC family permease n=1 Tax=Halorussus gelatinilyticus TaxID=2937524 RepID=A0A8U0IEM5_9EURY|nr:APC family permease [Halorussus gelatinilyticus]UPV99194.1 APC family permease [Halorussus gelatinilyticus]
MSDDLGLTEAVSMALGGMIGGGIYAVLGVVVKVSGPLAWLAFVLAGFVALCAGHSYVKLNELTDAQGGSPTYIESLTHNDTLAGMAGWTLLFGYIGSMAMYAYAFGSYFTDLVGIDHVVGLPVRALASVVVVAAFVGLNAVGVSETGEVEVVLVVIKVAILVGFAALGLYYGARRGQLRSGAGSLGVGPVMAAAVSFVAFQGWQLLMYDQSTIKNAGDTIRKAIYVSIPTAVVIYIGVAVVTTSLVSIGFVSKHPETALAVAARKFSGHLGYLVISLSALFSTASAINATLFSSTLFSNGLISDGLLPDRLGDDSSEMPTKPVLVVGVLTAAFTLFGSLEGITSFASLTFIVVFGGMSYLAFRQRDRPEVRAVVPAVGMVGTGLFLPLMVWHLYTAERRVFYSVGVIAVLVLAVELVYFETDIFGHQSGRASSGKG